MKISNRTILITGGGSGVGLDTARILSKMGNKILIIGRDQGRLFSAARGLQNVYPHVCDITRPEDISRLVRKVKEEFTDLSVLINNAATGHVYNHGEHASAFEKAGEEMMTNYLSIIRLNEKLLPVLKLQADAAIVNVTSMVSVAPMIAVPTYSDTKAALHSYSLSLRLTLSLDTSVRVFELMPPLINTGFSKEIGGETNGMPPAAVAQALINGMENDEDEIYVGQTRDFRDYYLSNPTDAFHTLNQS